MSTAEILSLISTISFVIAALSFILAVFFWFHFKIPSVISDLSGRTAKKSIARMQAGNGQASGRMYKPSMANAGRSKSTDTMQRSRRSTGDLKKPVGRQKDKTLAEDAMPETGLLASNKVVAPEGQQTDLLGDPETIRGRMGKDAAAPVHDEAKPTVKYTGGKKLNILDEVMLIHTDEVIHI